MTGTQMGVLISWILRFQFCTMSGSSNMFSGHLLTVLTQVQMMEAQLCQVHLFGTDKLTAVKIRNQSRSANQWQV